MTGSQQPHHAISEQLEAIESRDIDSVFHNAHDDVTLEIFAPPEFPIARQAKGLHEFREAITRNFGAVEEQRPHIREVFAEGDTVILFGSETGTLRDTAVSYSVEFVERFTFRDGRLAALRIVAAHVPAN